MTDRVADPRPLQVLRVYHSAVVTAWRKREAALEHEGLEVSTVTARQWNEGGAMVSLEARADEDITGVRTFGTHPFRFLYHPIELFRALRRNRRVDVLDIHEEPAALAMIETLVLARAAGCRAPVVCYSAQNILKRYPPPFRWFERWVLGHVAAVHSCNDEVAEVLAVKGFAGEVVNLGLGVDLDHFSPTAPDATADGPTCEAFRVGYVGRFTEQKGIFTLLAALAQLEGMQASFVGAGPDEARLRDAVAARGLEMRVCIQGFVAHDELPALYRDFDVIVVPSLDMPSWKEQFGRVVVEAMACGTPVVVSDGGALPEVAGDAGIVVAQGDASGLAEVLADLRRRPELARQLRSRGLERARHFSWERIAHDQAMVYRRAMR